MTNAAKNTEPDTLGDPTHGPGWSVKLLPLQAGGHFEVFLNSELGWIVLRLEAVEGWGAMHALTGDPVQSNGRVRVWGSAAQAMRDVERICPDCFGSVGQIMQRLAPCATCDGTGEL